MSGRLNAFLLSEPYPFGILTISQETFEAWQRPWGPTTLCSDTPNKWGLEGYHGFLWMDSLATRHAGTFRGASKENGWPICFDPTVEHGYARVTLWNEKGIVKVQL